MAAWDSAASDASNAAVTGAKLVNVLMPIKEEFMKKMEPAKDVYGGENVMVCMIKLFVCVLAGTLPGPYSTFDTFNMYAPQTEAEAANCIASVLIVMNAEMIIDATGSNSFLKGGKGIFSQDDLYDMLTGYFTLAGYTIPSKETLFNVLAIVSAMM